MPIMYVETDHDNKITTRETKATKFVAKPNRDKELDYESQKIRYYTVIECESPWFHDFVPYKGKIEMFWFEEFPD